MNLGELLTLHSNLVIFKYVFYTGVEKPDFFTFQSGYIQIGKFCLSKPSLTLFTFQSGYIQMLSID